MNPGDSAIESTNQAMPLRRRRGTRGPGPLGKGAKKFNVWFCGDEFRQIEAIAQKHRVAVGRVVRALVRRGLKQEPK